jgi:hypothetical protein
VLACRAGYKGTYRLLYWYCKIDNSFKKFQGEKGKMKDTLELELALA